MRRNRGSSFAPWVAVFLIYVLLCLIFNWSPAKSEVLHAVQPDPRIEWVEVDASGLVVCELGDTLKTAAPLPRGSVLYIPVVVSTPIRANRKQA
jgi:hypothetical protein